MLFLFNNFCSGIKNIYTILADHNAEPEFNLHHSFLAYDV